MYCDTVQHIAVQQILKYVFVYMCISVYMRIGIRICFVDVFMRMCACVYMRMCVCNNSTVHVKCNPSQDDKELPDRAVSTCLQRVGFERAF